MWIVHSMDCSSKYIKHLIQNVWIISQMLLPASPDHGSSPQNTVHIKYTASIYLAEFLQETLVSCNL